MNSILDLDARLSGQMRVAEKPGALRAIAVFFAHSGDSWFWAIGLFAIWISGDSFWKQWAVIQFASICLMAAMVLIIKFRIKRKRPEGEWGHIYRYTDPHSFPSGHAARAFLIATIATGLGPAWLAIALWVWAPLVDRSFLRPALADGCSLDLGAAGIAGTCCDGCPLSV